MAPPRVIEPGAADASGASMYEVEAVEARIAEVAGVIHGGHGALVAVVADALARRLWEGFGIHSPAQWLAWKSGLSIRVARQLVKVARRSEELPVAVGALTSGELSLDQVWSIAKHVPSAYDEAATELARHTTAAQLDRVLPRYCWDDDTDDAGDDSPDEPPCPEQRRRVSSWFDEDGHGRFTATLPTDEAMILEAALREARADLLAQSADASEADAFVHILRRYLSDRRADRPDADRYLVHAHLEQHPDGTPVLRSHLGPVLPDALRRYMTCDCDLRPVWNVHGTALSVGRSQRLVPDRTRRVLEHRDGGCVVPGCDRRSGLQVHHIVHWEHGGRTDTSNLCCLCRKHHRQHHLGLLGISGDADVSGGLAFTDEWGRSMPPAGRPEPIEADPAGAAAERDIPAPVHQPATNERMRLADVWLSPSPPGNST